MTAARHKRPLNPAFAMSQPAEVDVHEILFRPTRQALWCVNSIPNGRGA
jgi:hypothetical protein